MSTGRRVMTQPSLRTVPDRRPVFRQSACISTAFVRGLTAVLRRAVPRTTAAGTTWLALHGVGKP